MTNRTTHGHPDDDARCRIARQPTDELAVRTPTEVRAQLAATLAGTPHLSAEITRLAAELAAARLDLANLAAAALATIAAHEDGEPDPLSYLRDELAAQGYRPDRSRQ